VVDVVKARLDVSVKVVKARLDVSVKHPLSALIGGLADDFQGLLG
jgi:hypothetical protein